jgi:predicted Fe-Mo cluster-binding NifX family protein
MKYAIPMDERNGGTKISPVLGRAKYFAIYNTESKEIEYVNNPGATQPRGAGSVAARTIIELQTDKVITAHVGPNAQGALEIAEIEIVEENDITLDEVIEKYSK